MDTKIGYLNELREDLLEAAWRESLAPERKRPKRRGVRRALVGALAAATLAVAGVIGYAAIRPHAVPGSMALSDTTRSGSALSGHDPFAPVPAPSPTSAAAPGPGTWDSARTTDDAGSSAQHSLALGDANLQQQAGSAGGSAAPQAPGSDAPAPPIDNIIKTGSLSVVVPKGDFQNSLQAANDIAAKYGGYVQSSSTTGTRSGRLTIRVPADKFEAAIGDLQALGRVEHESTNGQDVTAQFVDLGARLKIAEQREAVISRLMDRANGISQVLQYRNLLEEAQLNVEQLKGQLRVLRNRSSLGTIALSLREEGVAAADAVKNPSLVGALKHSLEGFLRVLFAVIVGLGYLIPIVALAGVGWLVFRRVRRSA